MVNDLLRARPFAYRHRKSGNSPLHSFAVSRIMCRHGEDGASFLSRNPVQRFKSIISQWHVNITAFNSPQALIWRPAAERTPDGCADHWLVITACRVEACGSETAMLLLNCKFKLPDLTRDLLISSNPSSHL